MKQRTILVAAPHPDDETLGCGGTIALRAAEGCRIVVVVLTDGRNLFRLSPLKIEVDPTPAETSHMRKEETRRAVEILGGREPIRFLDVEDATLSQHVDAVATRLAAIIREVSPDEIYVTSEHEQHADHIAACAAVRAAMQQASSHAALYRYTVILRPGLALASICDPWMALDIRAQLPRKRQAVGQFASHLTVVAKGQAEPFFKDTQQWLQPVERFFVVGVP